MQIVTISLSSDNGNAHIDDDDSHDDEESGLMEGNRKRQVKKLPGQSTSRW